MTAEGAAVGGVLILGGAALLWIAWLGSQRRLPRNRVAGIRTRATLRSDAAWIAAHETAAAPLGLGGALTALAGLAVLVSGLDDVIGVAALVFAATVALSSVLVAARAGVAAARQVEGD